VSLWSSVGCVAGIGAGSTIWSMALAPSDGTGRSRWRHALSVTPVLPSGLPGPVLPPPLGTWHFDAATRRGEPVARFPGRGISAGAGRYRISAVRHNGCQRHISSGPRHPPHHSHHGGKTRFSDSYCRTQIPMMPMCHEYSETSPCALQPLRKREVDTSGVSACSIPARLGVPLWRIQRTSPHQVCYSLTREP
jgi:hypothetical protein